LHNNLVFSLFQHSIHKEPHVKRHKDPGHAVKHVRNWRFSATNF